jgi:molybdopterin-guanine dinucleotide biosynthesis protein A
VSVSGVILAGGSSSRLGQDKARIHAGDCSLIERVVAALRPLVSSTVLVAQSAERYVHLGLPVVADLYPGIGTLGGLHAGLSAIHADYALVVGCDMPFLSAGLLGYMIAQAPGHDVVMPRVGKYYEPLHALYARHCAPALERSILAGQRRIRAALDGLEVRYIETREIDRFDPEHRSFFNVNTPADLRRMNEILTEDTRD